MGNLAAVVDSGSTTKYRYNSSGQLVETIYADDTPDDDTDNPRTVTLYDKGDSPTETLRERERAKIDRIGGVTYYNYDAGGQLTETIYPDDAPDQVEKLIQAIAPGQTVETIDWTEVVYPDQAPNYLDGNPRSSTEYYKDGQVKAETDELGERVEYGYDPGDRRLLPVLTKTTTLPTVTTLQEIG